MMKVAVIGAGNGGQALAGHISSLGYSVRLYDRNRDRVERINKTKKIRLCGAVNTIGEIAVASSDIRSVITDADLIMIATTATAHRNLATQMSPFLKDGQIVILNPGRTCGALEFKNTLRECGNNHEIIVGEAQTLVYACRLIEDGLVSIIGIKDKVYVSAFPSSDNSLIIQTLNQIFSCFLTAKNILHTSFENVGAVFHPAVVIFNEAAIERGNKFYFYRDMTDGLARIIERIDEERLAVAKAYGISPISAYDWVSYAYEGVSGETLCERMHNNPAYFEILAPRSINCRQLTEDIPTGILPMSELGRVAGINTPMFDSLITISSSLLNTDFRATGRTLKRLGLFGKTKEEIFKIVD